jgi:long-chain acyl-CoA synthetase
MSATREAAVSSARAANADGAGSLVELVALQARRAPKATALLHKRHGIWHPMSWAMLEDRVRHAAAALRDLGVRPGEPVLIVSDARPAWLIVDLAIQAVGAVSVAAHPTQSPADLRAMLAGAPVRFGFCGDEDQLALAGEALEGLERRIILDPRFQLRSHGADSELYYEFLDRGEGAPAELRPPDVEQTAIGVPSAGSRAAPRIALFSHAAALAGARAGAEWLGLRPGQRNLAVVSPAQAAARVLDLYAPLVAGSTIAFPESPETVPENLLEIAPDFLVLIPRALELLRRDVDLRAAQSGRFKRAVNRWAAARRGGSGPAPRAARLLVDRAVVAKLGLSRARRVACVGGEPAPELLSFFWNLGVPVAVGYGQAGSLGLVSAQRGPEDAGTAGPPLSGVEVAAAEGALRVRTPTLAGSYLDGAPVAGADGWLDTGDRGRLDDEGRVVIEAAGHDIVGGQHLGRVESRLRLSPYVAEAVALPTGGGMRALVQIEVAAVADWALRRGLTGATFAALAASTDVHELIAGEVEKANALLDERERVRDFRLLPRPLSVQSGEMTPTLVVRRGAVEEAFDLLVAELSK